MQSHIERRALREFEVGHGIVGFAVSMPDAGGYRTVSPGSRTAKLPASWFAVSRMPPPGCKAMFIGPPCKLQEFLGLQLCVEDRSQWRIVADDDQVLPVGAKHAI
jgi:hypothetical protein